MKQDLNTRMHGEDYAKFIKSSESGTFSYSIEQYSKLGLSLDDVLSLALNHAIRINDQGSIKKILLSSCNFNVLTTIDNSGDSPLTSALRRYKAGEGVWELIKNHLYSAQFPKINLVGEDFLNVRVMANLSLSEYNTIHDNIDYLEKHFLSHIYTDVTIRELKSTFGRGVHFDAISYLTKCENNKSSISI